MHKVLYVCGTDQKYGSPMELKQLVGTIKKEGKIIPVVITETSGPLNTYLSKNKIENYVVGKVGFYIGSDKKWKLKIKKSFYLFYKLKFSIESKIMIKNVNKNINMNEIDLIHSNNSTSIIGALLSKKFKKPHVWHLREIFTTKSSFFSIPHDNIGYMNNNAVQFIAISKFIANSWINIGLDPSKVIIINDGINVGEFVNKDHKESKKLNIVQIGSISNFKGQYRLIYAFNKLPTYVKKNIYISFIGSGNKAYINELITLVNKLKLNNHIFFKGYINDARKQLFAYDIGIVSSEEGFGLITVEYMASDTTVIAINRGANSELIINEYNGLLYKDTDDLANKILFLYKNRDFNNILSSNALEVAKTKYSIIKTSQKICELYNNYWM